MQSYSKLKPLFKTDLFRTSFFTSISTLVKILTAFVLNKVVAIYVGPVGVALMGQFNNFFGIITRIGNVGIGTGVIKYIAENREDDANTRKIISTATFAMVVCSLIAGLAVFLFAGYFSNLIFKSEDYTFVFRLIAGSLIFASLNNLLMSVLNGQKEITKYTWASIITSLLILLLSVLLVANFKLIGVLVALVAGQSIIFFVTLFFVIKCHWFKIHYFFRYFDKTVLKKLSNYSLMTLVTSLTTPVALLLIRNYIGEHLSWEEAGYWQGVWSISEVYLMFVTSSLAVYYMPRLAEIHDHNELRMEILNTSKIIIPIISVMALIVFLIRSPLVNILFTNEFKPMLPLFKYQLLGDVIKIASWMIAVLMLSKAMTRLYIFTEIIFSLLFVVLSIILIRHYGLIGVTVSFCITYFFYLIVMLIAFRKSLLKKN